jgi:Family of unknown function (DUF5313)
MTRSERQIRLLLHAWPVTDQLERGDEIVGTSLDLVPEGRNSISPSMAMDLLAGGLKARWRGRLPTWWWLYYRAGGRLPARWQTWVYHDLTDRGWRRRIIANRLATALIAATIGTVITQLMLHYSQGSHPASRSWYWSGWDLPLAIAIYFTMLILGGLLVGNRATKIRDLQLRRHGIYWLERNDPPWPPPHPVQSTDRRELHDPDQL